MKDGKPKVKCPKPKTNKKYIELYDKQKLPQVEK